MNDNVKKTCYNVYAFMFYYLLLFTVPMNTRLNHWWIGALPVRAVSDPALLRLSSTSSTVICSAGITGAHIVNLTEGRQIRVTTKHVSNKKQWNFCKTKSVPCLWLLWSEWKSVLLRHILTQYRNILWYRSQRYSSLSYFISNGSKIYNRIPKDLNMFHSRQVPI